MRYLVWSAFVALIVGQAAHAQSLPEKQSTQLAPGGGHWNQEGGHWNQEASRSSQGLLVTTAVRLAVQVNLEAALAASKNNKDQATKACSTKLASEISQLLVKNPELLASDFPKDDNSVVRLEALSDDERACLNAAVTTLKSTLNVIKNQLSKGEGDQK
jgi:hypothetical protein